MQLATNMQNLGKLFVVSDEEPLTAENFRAMIQDFKTFLLLPSNESVAVSLANVLSAMEVIYSFHLYAKAEPVVRKLLCEELTEFVSKDTFLLRFRSDCPSELFSFFQ